MRPLALTLVFLVGCAGTVMDVETLKAEGYEHTKVAEITPSGALREVEHYELWIKERREAERTVRVCLVPRVESMEYNWYLTVLVDGKETWSYQSTRLSGKPGALHRQIGCTVSPPLPEGQLNFRVGFHYR